MRRTIVFEYNGAGYRVEFEDRMQKTRNLLRRGILQQRKSKKKQDEMPAQLRCTHCTIMKDSQPVANGMAICSPSDSFNSTTGRKTALQKTIQRSRREVKEPLDKDWATEAWHHFFESETPDARAARKRAKSHSAKE